MDKFLSSLVDFIADVDRDSLSPQVVDQVVRHTLDTVGCGAGGFSSAPATATRAVVRSSGGPLRASVYGEPERILVDFAAFANATANRYLDFNDFGSSGHPSDMIPAILGMAEATGATGADVVCSVYIAYEIATRLAEAVPRDGAWDQGLYCSLGVAGALAKMLRLSREQTANALSLAIVPSVPLRVTRFGELSQWKAAAAPHATMTATLAVRLAAEGMTAPSDPFEGKDGVFERVWPPFKIDLTDANGLASGIERSSIKRFGACYWAQVGIDIISQLRPQVRLDEIHSIEVATCRTAWWTIGGGSGDAEQRWRPPTRETADHSMPFLIASVLMDGQIDEATFDTARRTDPALLRVIDTISVIERSDLTDRSTRDRCPTEITIRMTDGASLNKVQDYPKGHPANPMSNEDVDAKFREFVSLVLPPDAARELADHLWSLPTLANLDGIGRLFRSFAIQ